MWTESIEVLNKPVSNSCGFCSEMDDMGEVRLLEEYQNDYNYAQVDMAEGDVLSVTLSTSNDGWVSQTLNYIKINYCPMCGRKLSYKNTY